MKKINWTLSGSSDFIEEPPVKMPQLLWQILQSRGVQTKSQVEEILEPSFKQLADPFSLDDMEKAVARLYQAKLKSEKICIYGDFDLDGTPGIALLKTGLKKLGFNDLILYQPKRLSDGYGFHAQVVKDMVARGVQLFITVDVGITGNEAVDTANSLAADVIITDHHLPGNELPEAYAIVNPNKGTCSSSLQHLCGAGVAFYLLLALRVYFADQGEDVSQFNPKDLLDCFAIATLTDLVPLVKENRILVKHGLVQLQNTKRPGLRCLLQELNLAGKELTSSDVAIRFAPKLNALSRMELDLLPIDVFTEENPENAKKLVSEVLRCNNMRLKLQAQAEDEAKVYLQARGFDKFIFIASENFHKGVIGLVATKLSQKFSVPCFIGSIQDDVIYGSARTPKGSDINLTEVLANAADILKTYGGHAPAAGFSMDTNSKGLFVESLQNFFASSESTGNEAVVIEYSAEASLTEITPQFMSWYEHLEPFGQAFETPILRIKDAKLGDIIPLKNGLHYKLQCQDANGRRLSALWFSPAANHPYNPLNLKLGDSLELLVEPQWNLFNGSKSLQLLIKDLKNSTGVS